MSSQHSSAIRIPCHNTSSQQMLKPNVTNEIDYSNNGLKIVKSFNQQSNSYSEQRLASSITSYLYSSLSPPSPTSYKLNDFKCSESFKDHSVNNLLSFNKRVSSTFIPDEEIQKLYSEIYSNDAQIDDIIRIMSFHPNYLKEFIKFNNYLMYSQGALSYESRHYLAIMAASRHKCYYLVSQQENEFLSIKGNKKWLAQQEFLPKKIRDLFEINKLLCHQPWLINRSHIENLLKNEYSNNWSITELIMAVTILCHFHGLSGLVFGLGINENYLNELSIKQQQINEENEKILKQKAENDHKNSEDLSMFDGEDDDDDYDCSDQNYDFNNENTFEFSDLSDSKLNRTMSNSSASSCEIGIEMLLKEMQMIQADDKLNEENKNLSISSTITNMQSLQKNASGTNTISNSPISTSLTNGHNYLTDSSNCSSPKYSHSFTAMNHAKRLNTHSHRIKSCNNENEEESDLDLLDNENTRLKFDDDTKLFNYQCEESDQFYKNQNELGNIAFNTKINNNSHFVKSKNNKKIKPNKYQPSQHKLVNNNNMVSSAEVASSQQPATSSNSSSSTSLIANNNHNHLASIYSQTNSYMQRYAYDPEFLRINFKNADQSLRLEFFTWERQGYSTASSIYSDICDLLDKKFRVAATMTYNTMGSHKDVDTSLFRRAIWLYIQSLFGVRYDDYDYNQIKQLIGSPLRNYIKILCSYPERVTKKDYEKIMKEFTHSEKVHLNIVIMEARVQASLLYFLRAINSYFS